MMGMYWEFVDIATVSKQKCSDINPSFKSMGVITRRCLRSEKWAPVNVSQCVMNSDSPVVMILGVKIRTKRKSLVKRKQNIIIQKVCHLIVNHR